MRTALIVPFFVSCIAGAALAQTSSPSPALKSPDRAAAPASGRGDTAKKRLANPKGDVAEALASCLAMWDPGTHMSRKQWARACRRVADRLKGTGIE